METTKTNGQLKCPECHNSLTRDTQNGETVCTTCGLVVCREPTLSLKPYFRQPVHELHWNKNLGSDERQVLRQLRRAMGLKISADVLHVDDSYIVKGLTLLARKLMNHNLTYGETAQLAKELRKRLKRLTTDRKIKEIVENFYREFFPEKPWLSCRICGRETWCSRMSRLTGFTCCTLKTRPDQDCINCPQRLCKEHLISP